MAPVPDSHQNDIEDDVQTQGGEVEPEASTELEITNTGDEHDPSTQQNSFVNTPSQPSKTPSVTESDSHELLGRQAPTFHLSKQHTGLKNRSYGVGMAVTPSNKMEFDQESREDFGVVKITRPIGKGAESPTVSHDMSTISSSGEGMTDQGYYDLKFYHNKLW